MAPVKEMQALDHLPVFAVIERFKVKDDATAAKTAQQTNAPQKGALSQSAMGEFPGLDPGIASAHELARQFRVS
jgi:hypothetical protein